MSTNLHPRGYGDIQVTTKGYILKFASGTIVPNENFDIVKREQSKGYRKSGQKLVILVSKKNYNIHIEGSQIFNLVINRPFEFFSKL